jgi:hypothetical protein
MSEPVTAPVAEPVAAPSPEVPATEVAPETPAAEAKKDPAAEAKKSNKKKIPIKVDSQVEEVEIDLDNEEELRKQLQLARVAQKRMQQFSEYEKGVKGLLETLKTDPLKVLADPRLGIPIDVQRKMADAIINNEIEEMSKSPEQKEAEKRQKEYEQLKKELEDTKKKQEQERFQMMQAQAAKEFDVEISSAIEKAGLPKNARTVKYLADAMLLCYDNKIDMTFEELVPYVRKEIMGDFRDLIGALPDEEFEDWLGKDQVGRLRKRSLAKLKSAATAAPVAEQVKPTGDAERKQVEDKSAKSKIPLRDFLKGL